MTIPTRSELEAEARERRDKAIREARAAIITAMRCDAAHLLHGEAVEVVILCGDVGVIVQGLASEFAAAGYHLTAKEPVSVTVHMVSC